MKGVIIKMKSKLICYILSLLMIVSAITPAMVVLADETDEANQQVETAEVLEGTETAQDADSAENIEDAETEETAEDTETAADAETAEEEFKLSINYLRQGYVSKEDKLASMQLYFGSEEQYPYEIYGKEETGEVGIRVKETGQILLTNPYDVAFTTSNDSIKSQLLSQIVLTYSDGAGSVVSFNSYKDAASYGQIKMKRIRDGLRTEYTIGKEASKYLVPKMIEKSSFEENILAKFKDKTAREYRQLVSYFTLYDAFDEEATASEIKSMTMQWPVTEKYAIYVIDPGITNRELGVLESTISANTEYSFDMMEEDYALLDYVDTSAAPALFRFAIEYKQDENGLEITLPAGSIKYDSSNYKLRNFNLLPYLGAGSNENKGFTFVPDGSGTITRFEDIADRAFNLSGKMYGKDYSYHAISGYTQETMRLPALGVIETAPIRSMGEKTEPVVSYDENGQEIVTIPNYSQAQFKKSKVVDYATEGFVAYYTEGDALAEIYSSHGGTVHKYSSVYAYFDPKPVDTYSLTGISEDGSATWSVTSESKYVGNYTMRVFPISGDGIDYTDMAEQIRNYLEKTGTLTRLDPENDVSENTSLYVENFGTINTQEKLAGFPVTVQTPLTTFEQTQDMINELAQAGIDNINVKLTGWYNGGMKHTAPSKVKVASKLGGKSGLEDLIAFANEKNVGVYPDLDFTYVDTFGSFDGFGAKKDSAKTLDNRSAGHRVYNALYQGFENDKKLIISPASMSKFYGKIEEDLLDLGITNISVATLGSDLNSDHNEDYTLDREASEAVITSVFDDMKNNKLGIMVNGGNAYSLGYASHILDVPLDSSMNINTSMSVPFMGMVLHGYTEFAGTAINLDGDYEYSVLKAIENGANLYYMVSKDNTSELKLFPEFNKYYAIRYDNWKQDMIDTYTNFNNAMKKVKYSLIDEHEYLSTRLVRVAYDNGIEFVLNYNAHDIKLDDGTVVEAMDFIVRDMEGVLIDD